MAEKYQNKYRVSSARLQNWDYGSNAAYFVTICTQNHHHYFGDVVDGEMQLSEIGKIAERFWREIPDHFPFVLLDVFVVMPNHVHGIIIINKDEDVASTVIVETPKLGVSTDTIAPQKNKWKPGTLGVIINQYKRICTINARKTDPNFAWQSRFHDHIIRSDKSYETIREYIFYNPAKWEEDKYYA